ncbi:MAG: electron transfer flavoprotein subunit beta/FixA family protein [Bacteroidales bacterium]
MRGLKIILLAKQVPDTRNVGKDAMKADGTVNRAALTAIFNPEDMNALELALRIKDKNPGTVITVVTMGPARAAGIIREAMYRGADGGYLVTDRKFAGSDTLATSYALSLAIMKLAPFDMVIAGRQAIDGDTAQVGPQVAEKLGLPQVTYAEEVITVDENEVIVKRRIERGVETVASPMPLVITVHGSAPECRARHAKYTIKYKRARSLSELQDTSEDYLQLQKDRPHLMIEEWNVDDIDADEKQLGLSGSPTKVKKIENVVFTSRESRVLAGEDSEIEQLMKDLIDNHTIG